MKTNRTQTRMLAGVLALVMSLTMLTPALAAEEPDTLPPEEAQEMNSTPDETLLEPEQGPYADSGSVIYLSADGSDDAPGSEASPKATLAAAYAAVPEDGTIIVMGTVALEEPVTFDEDKRFTLAGYSGGVITYTGTDNISSAAGMLCVVTGELTFQDVTIQMPEARGVNGRPLYVGPGGSATLASGAVLAGGYLAYSGGNVLVDGGKLNMEDGAVIRDAYIANNTACYGGGVLVTNGGSFRMDGGEVCDNTIHTTQGFESFGGGVSVDSGAWFKMYGGIIRGNSVDTNGGGVYLAPGGRMNVSGQITIHGNEAGGVEDNVILPNAETRFTLSGRVTGSVGVTSGDAAYGVVIAGPNDYDIHKQDEDAFFYDGGVYDIRLQDGNLVLYWFTVGVEVNIDGATSENKADEAIIEQDYDTVLIPDEGYQLPEDITVTVGGVELDDGAYTYDPDTGALHIPGEEVTGDISITVAADQQHTLTVSAVNASTDVDELVVIRQDVTVITITPAPRYGLPTEADITVDGPCTHSYDPATGKLTISEATGDVSISIQGAEVYHTIYFDPTDGACATASKRIPESQGTYGELPTPTLTGYTFSGWYAGEVLVDAETPNHLVEDLHLTARWTARTDIHYEVRHWLEYTDGGLNPGYSGGDLHTMAWGGVERQYYIYRTDAHEDGVANGSVTIVPLTLSDLGGGLELAGLTPSGANQYAVTMAPDGSSIFPLYYDRNPYRVSYDANGGVLQGAAHTDLIYGGLYGALPDATRAGYTLIGWFTDTHGGRQVQADQPYLESTDQTLYAHWSPVGDTHYTVYHLAQVLHDNTVSYDKTPDNYTLIQTDDLTGTSDTAVDLYTMAVAGFVPSGENIYTVTILADGTAVAYLYYDRLITDVNYDAQGGTPVTTGSRLYHGGTFASLPGDPAMVGHHFMGWYTSPDPTAQKVSIGTAIDDINPKGLTALTLYARWAPNTYELVFDTHGGVLSGGKTVTYGEPIGALPTAELTGYIFKAWYDADGKLGVPEGRLVTAETVVSTETLIHVDDFGAESVGTLYAWYDPIEVTITFDPSPGALQGQDSLTMSYDKTFGHAGDFPVPTRPGYTFEAWHFESSTGPKLEADAVCKLLEDTTVYASYTPNIYVVDLDVAGGEPLDLPRILATRDAPYGELPTPKRTGYTFQGWFNAEGREITSSTIVELTAPETLTARWKANQYTVTFDSNGGDPMGEGNSTRSVIYDAPFGALPTPTRSGSYAFSGWYTEKDGGIHITAESQVKLITDTTLYAHWRFTGGGGGGGGGGNSTTEYTITFEVNGGTKLSPVTAAPGTVVKLADYTTTREGYKFLGWYLDKDLKEAAGDAMKLTKNTTLYAAWEKAPSGWAAILNTEDHMAYIEGLPDGTVRPCAPITRAEVAMIFYRLMRGEAHAQFDTDKNSFTDVDTGAWYATAVSTLASMGIVKGRGNNAFDPTAPITRGEFAAIAARFSDGKYDGADQFTDISGHWARAEINQAAALGWVYGDGSGAFHPNDLITRAEVMTLVNRVLGRMADKDGLIIPGMKTFPDNAPSAWYYYDVVEATNGHTYHMEGGLEHWDTLTD